MTDTPTITPGSEWLLPVRIEDISGRYPEIVVIKGYSPRLNLTDNEVKTFIPASRLTDLEAEVARWQQLYEDARHDLTKAEMEVEKLKEWQALAIGLFYKTEIRNSDD
jgi:hypothetical protein